MKLFLLIILGIFISCGLHVLIGWEAALVAPLGLALYKPHRGWLTGSLVMLTAWALIFAANFIVAPEPSFHAVSTIAGFIGQPTFVPPVASLLLAALVGALAGMLGSGLRRFV